jgi:hypothetical protein
MEDNKEALSFESMKEMLLRDAYWNNACKVGMNDGKRAKTRKQLLNAIIKHFRWLRDHKIITTEFMKINFTEKERKAVGLYIGGTDYIKNLTKPIIICGDADIEIPFNDRVLIKVFDNAHLTVRGYGHLHAYENSTIYAHGFMTVTADDDSTVDVGGSVSVEAYRCSKVLLHNYCTVRASHSTHVIAEHFTSVVLFDYSRCEATDTATVVQRGHGEVKLYQDAIERHNYDIISLKDRLTFLEYVEPKEDGTEGEFGTE